MNQDKVRSRLDSLMGEIEGCDYAAIADFFRSRHIVGEPGATGGCLVHNFLRPRFKAKFSISVGYKNDETTVGDIEIRHGEQRVCHTFSGDLLRFIKDFDARKFADLEDPRWRAEEEAKDAGTGIELSPIPDAELVPA